MLEGLLQYYNQQAQSGLSKLGSMAGGAIGGGIAGMGNSGKIADANMVSRGEVDPSIPMTNISPSPVAPGAPTGLFSGAWQGLAGEAGGEQYKRLIHGGRAADAFMSYMGDEGFKSLNMSPEQFKTLGAEDKMGAVSGLLQGTAYKQGAQDYAMKLQAQQQNLAAMKRASDEADAMQGFARDLASAAAPSEAGPVDATARGEISPDVPVTSGTNPPAGMSPEMAFANALRRNPGALASPQFDNSLNAITRMHKGTGTDRTGTVTPLGSGKGFLWLSPSSGKDIDMSAKGDETTVENPAANVTVVTPKGGKPQVHFDTEKMSPLTQGTYDNLLAQHAALTSEIADLSLKNPKEKVGYIPFTQTYGGLLAEKMKKQQLLLLQMDELKKQGSIQQKRTPVATTPTTKTGIWDQYNKWKNQ
jgi:hypothetical protein